MKFFYAKKDLRCLACGAFILKGEAVTRIFARKEIDGQKTGYVLFFHTECYPPYFINWYNKQLEHWYHSHEKPKKVGRPKKYLHGKEVHKTKSLMRYHKEAGNMDRVMELTAELKTLIMDNDG